MSKEEFPHEKDLKDEVTPDKAPKSNGRWYRWRQYEAGQTQRHWG